jgi:hypothetical protein
MTKQIDTTEFETKVLSGDGPVGQETIARTVFWLRLANLLATAHELLIDQVKKLKDEKS